MITFYMFGTISLNCSFILYLLVYLPQIIHNHQSNHLATLSLGMHFILYLGYFLDLFYGFSSQLPWQYKTVSLVGLTLLTIQHLQITYYWWIKKKLFLTSCNLFFLLSTLSFLFYFFKIDSECFTVQSTALIGYISRVLFILYSLPQIIKNYRIKYANAITIRFVYLNLALCTFDMVSAWCLNWGWPNKLASPLMFCLMLVLLIQIRTYSSKNAYAESQFITNDAL